MYLNNKNNLNSLPGMFVPAMHMFFYANRKTFKILGYGKKDGEYVWYYQSLSEDDSEERYLSDDKIFEFARKGIIVKM